MQDSLSPTSKPSFDRITKSIKFCNNSNRNELFYFQEVIMISRLFLYLKNENENEKQKKKKKKNCFFSFLIK